jgi:hypothetical protein
MPKKKKSKRKSVGRKTKREARKRTTTTPKKSASSSRNKPVKKSFASATLDPIGACYWVDNTGQNHCTVTTKSLCQKQPNSTFRQNKQCAGGV